MGLCAAYNIGIGRAKYNYICFSHEDILFHTENWGVNLIENFKSDENIGLIGIAGSSYKTLVPSAWSFPQESNVIRMFFPQERNGISDFIFYNPYYENISEVTALNGC